MLCDSFFFVLESGARDLGLLGRQIRHETASFDRAVYEVAAGETFSSHTEAYAHWMAVGRRRGLEFAAGRDTYLKVVLKAKDEPELIDAWIRHHGRIVGLHNLIVLDCGSTSAAYLRALDRYRGLVTVLDYRRYYDHIHSVHSNAVFFRAIAAECRFVTLLDADEFLIFRSGDEWSSSRAAARASLGEEPEVMPGTWIHNAGPLQMSGNGIDWDTDIPLVLDANAVRAGTVAGKAVIRSDVLFDAHHLGHNLHVREVASRLRSDVFGRLVVLHLSQLPGDIRRARLRKNLIAKGVLPPDLSGVEEVRALEQIVDSGTCIDPQAVAYARNYLATLTAASVPASAATAATRLLTDACRAEAIPELTIHLDAFDFAGLLDERRRMLGPA